MHGASDCSRPNDTQLVGEADHDVQEYDGDRLDSLLKWLDANNVWLHPSLSIKLGTDNRDYPAYGIFAAGSDVLQDVQEDCVVATIPKSAVLSKKTGSLALTYPHHFEAFLAAVFTYPDERCQRSAETLILATLLVFEFRAGLSSRFYGYITSLPQDVQHVGLPAFWADSQAVSWLEGTDVQALMERQGSDKATLQIIFDKVIRPTLDTTGCQVVWPDFALAYSIVSSRAFSIDNFHGLALTPLADIFNHYYNPNVTLQTDDIVCPICGSYLNCRHDEESDAGGSISSKPEQAGRSGTNATSSDVESVEMVCLTPSLVEGTKEVFNTYGNLSNAFLLTNYGFSLEGNSQDKLHWFTLFDVERQALPDTPTSSMSAITLLTLRMAVANASSSSSYSSNSRVEDPAQVYLWDSSAQEPHDLLYINADGELSIGLYTLLRLLHTSCGTETFEELVARLCYARLRRMHGSQMTLPELADLAYLPSTSIQMCLAILRCIEERTMLETCLGLWMSDSD